MFRKGFIQQQIEEMARVIAHAIARLTELPSPEARLENLTQFTHDQLDWKEGFPQNENWIDTLVASERFDPANLELLGDLFLAAARDPENKDRTRYAQKSLELYRYLDTAGRTFSLERAQKIAWLTQNF